MKTSLIYTLGKTVYIPLTSKSNCLTLPQTRGKQFQLPNSVIQSLIQVRCIENNNDMELNQCTEIEADGKSILPPPSSFNKAPSFPLQNDESINPSFEYIHSEIHKYRENNEISSLVFAGEGEPTLRWKSLNLLASKLRLDFGDKTKIRLVTNGLILSNTSEDRRELMLNELKSNGIDELSIAFMTSCPEQFDLLMEPVSHEDDKLKDKQSWHQELCHTIQDAVKVGLFVECTGVEREEVDKHAAEEMARELGVSSFRWRPYFP